MRRLICIDPGPVTSGYVELETHVWPPRLVGGESEAKLNNEELLVVLENCGAEQAVIERIDSYGMPVGEEVFETVRWAAFFELALGREHVTRIRRLDVKHALCHSSRANDATIRQAILDLYGGKAAAIGTKKAPGPLYGVHGDAWAALAVGLTRIIQQRESAKEAA